MARDYLNGNGYPDKTAYEAINNVMREEKRKMKAMKEKETLDRMSRRLTAYADRIQREARKEKKKQKC